MNWIEKRIRAEKRKHDKWAGYDEWMKIAGTKIGAEINRLILEEIVMAHKEGEKTSRLTSLWNKINK